jgi:hypothetical protein
MEAGTILRDRDAVSGIERTLAPLDRQKIRQISKDGTDGLRGRISHWHREWGWNRQCCLFSAARHSWTGIRRHVSLIAKGRSSQTSPLWTLFLHLSPSLRLLFNGLVHLARGSFSRALATLATF